MAKLCGSLKILFQIFKFEDSKMIWFSVSKHTFFLTKSQSHRMLFTQLFLTLLMNALQQSLCFLEVTLLLGRRTPKTLSSNGFQRLGREQHTRNQNLLIFSTRILLDFIFLTPSQRLRVASPATVQQRLWWPRWLLGTCFAHASVSHVNTGFGQKI